MFDGSTWYLQKGCETRHRLCFGAHCKVLFCTFIFGKEQRRLFSPRQLLHGSASLQGKLLIWNCLIFRSLKPTCQFWQSYYIIFDILLQLDSLVCQNVQSQEVILSHRICMWLRRGKMAMVCPCLLALSQWTRASGCKGFILASHHVQGPTQRFHVVIRLRIAKHASSWEYGEIVLASSLVPICGVIDQWYTVAEVKVSKGNTMWHRNTYIVYMYTCILI